MNYRHSDLQPFRVSSFKRFSPVFRALFHFSAVQLHLLGAIQIARSTPDRFVQRDLVLDVAVSLVAWMYSEYHAPLGMQIECMRSARVDGPIID
mmetsp:Transcript_88616/g.239799  ORF Transcript_88616/g.239799 Transcript_88616/m.239799 type:complete len:94 (+) Transcript_88616:450-731(+)